MRAGRHAALLVMGATLALLVGVEGKSPADARSEPGLAGSTADAVAYQINPGHDGSQPDDSLVPALTRAWMIDFDAPDPTAPQGPVSYPLIVNGKVYVIADSLAQGPILTAIDLATGTRLWTTPLTNPIQHVQHSAAYDNGRIFVGSSLGVLTALDAQTGAVAWTAQRANQAFGPPTAVNGRVYVGHTTGTSAYDEARGSLLWTQPYDAGVVALSVAGAYLTKTNHAAYDLDPATGSLLWKNECFACGSGFGNLTVLHDGLLYNTLYGGESSLVYDAQSGNVIGNYAADRIPPTFDGTRGFFMKNGTLEARDLTSQAVLWSFAGDAKLDFAPLAVNGYVYIGWRGGNVYALDSVTGRVVWSDAVGTNMAPNGMGTVMQIGMAAGNGALVVPFNNKLVTYTSTGNGPNPPPPPANVPPGSGPPATAYQINPEHDGSQPLNAVAPPLQELWSVDLGGNVSYPLIENGLIHVVAGNRGSNGVKLYALDPRDGQPAWGPIFTDGFGVNGDTSWLNRANLAYDGGKVFELTYRGLLQAFDARSGGLLWSRVFGAWEPPYADEALAQLAALNGTVYVATHNNSHLRAIDESTGAIRWDSRGPVDAGPAVTATGVYGTAPWSMAAEYSPATGDPVWTFSGCNGGWGQIPVVAGGKLYDRSHCGPGYVLDAATGNQVGSFDADVAPTFDGSLGFYLYNGALEARDVNTQSLTWSFSGDGRLQTAPIVANGVVYIGSAGGNFYALSESTGEQVWSDNVGVPITAPDEMGPAFPLAGLAAGQGLVPVAAGAKLN